MTWCENDDDVKPTPPGGKAGYRNETQRTVLEGRCGYLPLQQELSVPRGRH